MSFPSEDLIDDTALADALLSLMQRATLEIAHRIDFDYWWSYHVLCDRSLRRRAKRARLKSPWWPGINGAPIYDRATEWARFCRERGLKPEA